MVCPRFFRNFVPVNHQIYNFMLQQVSIYEVGAEECRTSAQDFLQSFALSHNEEMLLRDFGVYFQAYRYYKMLNRDEWPYVMANALDAVFYLMECTNFCRCYGSGLSMGQDLVRLNSLAHKFAVRYCADRGTLTY